MGPGLMLSDAHKLEMRHALQQIQKRRHWSGPDCQGLDCMDQKTRVRTAYQHSAGQYVRESENAPPVPGAPYGLHQSLSVLKHRDRYGAPIGSTTSEPADPATPLPLASMRPHDQLDGARHH